MTTGNSVLKAVNSAKEAGATVVQIFVLVDREEQDRSPDLKAYDWAPIFKVSELLAS